eukprot:CAMPEP_0119051346 /NCGR_PEP_ID=MMETSP1177-20130426/72991_1 /TAXON_ID=2985 /ORGANISM="Ochromonas sp, Strain CCMP1899" /LENGTH=567 /DNA_ID=CAMNT_0007030521 /DNA_START=188 /DNA_END=1891 /DNA_ORIENTATION=+
MEQLSESPEKVALSNSPESPEKPIIDSEEKEHDYYAILEIPSTASNEFIGQAYNRIFNRLTALQHSHDGPQAPETMKNFKDLEEAYQILSNPVRRKVYDNRNHVPQQQSESIINQTYKAIVSRLRSPSISVVGGGIAAEVIENVVQICQGGIEGVKDPPLDPRVVDMTWGTTIDGRVDRQAACYYRISISNENLSKGFLLNCKSSNKDRFKLVMFDSSGKLLHLEDSMRSKDTKSTEATLLFTLFNTGNQIESDSVDEKILSSPHFLSEKLESIVSYERVVPPGDFLICIYGDNMIGKANFNLIAVPANNDATEVTIIKAADTSLITLKRDLKGLEAEYVKARNAFEIAASNVKREEQRAEKLLQARDIAYKGFIDSSLALFPTQSRSVAVVADQSISSTIDTRDTRNTSHEQDSDVHEKNTVAGVAGSTAVMAATSASNAGGWLMKKVSGTLADGLTQLQRKRESPSAATSPRTQSSNQDEEITFPVEISQSLSNDQGSVIPSDQESVIPIVNDNEGESIEVEGITNDVANEKEATIDDSIIDQNKDENTTSSPITDSEADLPMPI